MTKTRKKQNDNMPVEKLVVSWNYWVLGFCQSGILKNSREVKFSETASVSILGQRGGGHLLCWVRYKTIPVTGHGGLIGLWDVEAPTFLNNRLPDGGEVVSPVHRPPFTLHEDSWYSFLLEAESMPGP
jgi:hypothetical protein